MDKDLTKAIAKLVHQIFPDTASVLREVISGTRNHEENQ